MIDIYVLASMVMGVCAVTFLIVQRVLAHGQKLNLAEGVIAFITGAAILAGIKLCFLSLNPAFFSEVTNERPYIFLGGFAVVWVSIETLWTLFSKKSQCNDGDTNSH